MDGRTVVGRINQSGGGVARNVADALGKLGVNPYLISAVGDEEFGRFVLSRTIPHLSTKGIKKERGSRTGTCLVICDGGGECVLCVGAMGIHGRLSEEEVRGHEGVIRRCRLLVLDGNLSQETTEFVLRLSHQNSVPVWFEPTDIFLSAKPFLNKNVPPPTFISPNFLEFKKIIETVYPGTVVRAEKGNQIEECIEKGYLLAELIDNIIITLGKTGVMVIRRGGQSVPFFSREGRKLDVKGEISHRMYKPSVVGPDEIVNVSGAGDCFASGFIAAMLRGETEERCIQSGFACSGASLRCSDAVPEKF